MESKETRRFALEFAERLNTGRPAEQLLNVARRLAHWIEHGDIAATGGNAGVRLGDRVRVKPNQWFPLGAEGIVVADYVDLEGRMVSIEEDNVSDGREPIKVRIEELEPM